MRSRPPDRVGSRPDHAREHRRQRHHPGRDGVGQHAKDEPDRLRDARPGVGGKRIRRRAHLPHPQRRHPLRRVIRRAPEPRADRRCPRPVGAGRRAWRAPTPDPRMASAPAPARPTAKSRRGCPAAPQRAPRMASPPASRPTSAPLRAARDVVRSTPVSPRRPTCGGQRPVRAFPTAAADGIVGSTMRAVHRCLPRNIRLTRRLTRRAGATPASRCRAGVEIGTCALACDVGCDSRSGPCAWQPGRPRSRGCARGGALSPRSERRPPPQTRSCRDKGRSARVCVTLGRGTARDRAGVSGRLRRAASSWDALTTSWLSRPERSAGRMPGRGGARLAAREP